MVSIHIDDREPLLLADDDESHPDPRANSDGGHVISHSFFYLTVSFLAVGAPQV